MTTDKRGISALLLQRQLALGRYETAWMMLHKFRRAMVNLAREPLQGEVEVDDTWVGGTQAGLRGSRQRKGRKAALVIVAVERRDRVTGRIRMAVIPDFKSTTMTGFLKQNVAPGSTVFTDGLKSFTRLKEAGYHHMPQSQPLRTDLRKGAKSVVPLADRAIGNLQQWLIGTYHGVSRDQLQVYLDEFVFRHNRRRQPMAAFQTLLGLGTTRKPTHLRPDTGREGPSEEPGTGLTAIYGGLLKQPDKQGLTKDLRAAWTRVPSAVCPLVSCPSGRAVEPLIAFSAGPASSRGIQGRPHCESAHVVNVKQASVRERLVIEPYLRAFIQIDRNAHST